jgi:hypothetical protein
VVAGPALTWVLPFSNDCAAQPRERLVVTGSSTAMATKVQFRVDGNLVGTDRSGPGGVWALVWNTKGLKQGRHHLTATLLDRAGRSDTAGRTVRICK